MTERKKERIQKPTSPVQASPLVPPTVLDVSKSVWNTSWLESTQAKAQKPDQVGDGPRWIFF